MRRYIFAAAQTNSVPGVPPFFPTFDQERRTLHVHIYILYININQYKYLVGCLLYVYDVMNPLRFRTLFVSRLIIYGALYPTLSVVILFSISALTFLLLSLLIYEPLSMFYFYIDCIIHILRL